MPIKLNDNYVKAFVSEEELAAMQPEVTKAHELLTSKTGPGNDFTGWVELPTDYDKEEFARIKAAAEKIRKQADVLIVIGIGGSYLAPVRPLSSAVPRIIIY